MCQQIDRKMHLLLKKIALLNKELEEILCNKNDISSIKFKKIDTALYKTTDYKNGTLYAGWYGADQSKEQVIVFYVDKNPVSILLFFENKTFKLVEVEFIDWTGEVCYKDIDCLDIALNSKITLQDLKNEIRVE